MFTSIHDTLNITTYMCRCEMSVSSKKFDTFCRFDTFPENQIPVKLKVRIILVQNEIKIIQSPQENTTMT